MYFQVIGSQAGYTMEAIGESPDAHCSGPDIIESMATK
jgi:hypothetical protein